MAKPVGGRVKPEFRELYDLLHCAFLGEKLVVLQSIFHDVETSLAGSLRRPIRSRQSTLGHVELEHPLHVKECQIARAIKRHLGHSDAGDVICHEDAAHRA
jgi:hypothetical protein